MFYRRGFVTNSSSTSFYGYGISLSKFRYEIATGLVHRYDEFVRTQLDEEQLEDYTSYQEEDARVDWLLEHLTQDYGDDILDEWMREFLLYKGSDAATVKDIGLEYGEDALYWSAETPTVTINSDGSVVVESDKFSKRVKVIHDLIEMLDLDTSVSYFEECYRDG